MNQTVLYPLRRDDLVDVARIHATCFDDPWEERMLGRVLSMPGAFGLAARRQDRLVGFALGRVAADECELLSLGVASEFRREGIGATILDAAMEWASLAGARSFFLEVAENNQSALRLYAGRSMVMVGRRPRYYTLKHGGYAAAYTMRCGLSSSMARTG